MHAIERKTLEAVPGLKAAYAGREQFDAEFTRLLSGLKRVAMEYSPDCAIPYISRSTAAQSKLYAAGAIEVRSSGDLA